MGSAGMNLDFDYGLLQDVDAYLHATPRPTPNTSKTLGINGRVSAMDGGNASSRPQAHTNSANRRGPRRPISVIGEGAVLDGVLAMEQPGTNTNRDKDGTGSGNEPHFGDHAFGNLSDMGYVHSRQGSGANRNGAGKRDDAVKLPSITVTPPSTQTKGLRPMSHNANNNGSSTSTGAAPPPGNGYGNVAASADRARTSEYAASSRAHPPASATTPLNPNSRGGGNERRFLAVPPNGRVSPLMSESVKEHMVVQDSPGRVGEGWVKEQARRLNEEMRRNSPLVDARANHSLNHSPNPNSSPIGGGGVMARVGDKVVATGWGSEGYDLGLGLDSFSGFNNVGGADHATDNTVAVANQAAAAASGFPSSPSNARRQSQPSVAAPAPSVARPPFPRSKPTSATTTAKTDADATTNTSSAAATGRRKIRVNGAGEVLPTSTAAAPTAARGANPVSKPATTAAGATTDSAEEFQQMPKATGGRAPPWRTAKLSATDATAGTTGGAAPPAATTIAPAKGLNVAPPNTAKGEPYTNGSTSGVVPPSLTDTLAPAGSTTTSPSHNRRIKMEAVDTSAVPSVVNSSMNITPSSNRASTAEMANLSRGVSAAITARAPSQNAQGASLPLTSPGSARAFVSLPYTPNKQKHMDAWQTNFQLLSPAPAPLYNAEHCNTAANNPQQWYPRERRVPVEMAGESVELDEQMHNVFTLMRQRQRPINPEYPRILPVPLDVQNLRRRPKTPRSFYGPKMPHQGKDWFKDALADAKEVPSPNLEALDKIDGDKRQRGGPRR